MVWRRGKGLDPRRAHAAIKLRTASKANGNLHPKKLQHLPFLRSFWMVFFSLLFFSHTPYASISGLERKYWGNEWSEAGFGGNDRCKFMFVAMDHLQDLEGVLKKVGKRLQNQLPQSTALVAAYSMWIHMWVLTVSVEPSILQLMWCLLACIWKILISDGMLCIPEKPLIKWMMWEWCGATIKLLHCSVLQTTWAHSDSAEVPK